MTRIYAKGFLTLISLLLSIVTIAQMNCAHQGCSGVRCMGIIGLEEQHDSFVPPPADFVPNASRDVVISVTYNGFSPQAQAAFQYAVDIWASLLTSNVPIIVDATWEDIPGNTLGFAGPTGLYQNFGGAPENNVLYPTPLANKLNGSDLDPGNADITASFDSGTNWYLGLDGNPGAGQFDFVSVVLHELGHGLGVVGTAVVDGTSGFILNNNPSVYDTFVENGGGAALLNFPEGNSMYQQLTGEDLFWNGNFAMANNGNIEPELYAPSDWQQGSSYSHVDENSYPAGSGNSLMTPFIAPGEAIHDPGPIIMGLMEDIGWTVDNEPQVCDDLPYQLVLTPDCYGTEITWIVQNEQNVTVASGGPYANNFPEDILPIQVELCLEPGCYTFTISDSFGDGLAGSGEAECGVDGDFFITDPQGNVVVQMGPANYGSSDSYEFCTETGGDIFGCTDPAATNYNPNATVNDGSCEYDGACLPTQITLTENCIWDEETETIVNRILVVPTISGACTIENVCFTPTGTADETCFFLPDFGIILESGEGVFIPLPGPGSYEVYMTTSEGQSPTEVIAVDCSDAITGCANPFAANYNPIVEVNIPSECEYDEFICDCAGTQHTIGVLTWLGDGFLDDGSFQWDGQEVDFNCETWGYDCADGGIEDDPNGVCEGNLPPNNGCLETGCAPLDLTITQLPCQDTGDDLGLLPVINFDFSINGGCLVQEFCFQIDGGGFNCFDLPDLNIFVGENTDLFLTNTTPNATYEFYYVAEDGFVSPTYTWENGDCLNEETICDCDGTQHAIGVLAWLGDDIGDVGNEVWNGQTVNFNCATWGFDCGDIGPLEDPFGVCDGNLPPNNGCVDEILGCTDATALNYDPTATINDGSCIYELEGCTDELACNYDAEATADDGSCTYDCYGCTDIAANNYDPTATIDDGSCTYSETGCTDPEACNYNPEATINDGSCNYDCFGCTDLAACNYDPDATIDNGSCDFTCYGCTNPNACNYDPDATINDGSCDFSCFGCTDPEACNFDPNATVDNGSCDYSCYGCTDPLATNYDATATIDDGSCIYEGGGCTDPEACNYDPNALVDDGSCDYSCYGCTDDEACNYDPDATIDDDSCDYSCYGCTDEDAINYDPDATIDDGSCVYDCDLPTLEFNVIGCNDGEAGFYIELDFDDLGNGQPYEVTNSENNDVTEVNSTGVVLIGPFIEGNTIDVVIESTIYDDCDIQLNDVSCPDSVLEEDLSRVEVYPNPVSDILTISSVGIDGLTIELVDITGKRIHFEEFGNASGVINLEVNDLSNGIYLLNLRSDVDTHTRKVVVRH